MAEAASHVGVSAMSVRRLLERGVIKGDQVVPYAPWMIKREDLKTSAVQEAISAIRSGGKCERRIEPGQEGLCLLDV